MKQEAEVQTHRIERAQPEISDLRQEITAVTKALDHQLSALDALREGFLSQRAGWSYLNNGDRKHEVSVIKECISHVENRIKGFEEMRFQATELENWVCALSEHQWFSEIDRCFAEYSEDCLDQRSTG